MNRIPQIVNLILAVDLILSNLNVIITGKQIISVVGWLYSFGQWTADDSYSLISAHKI